MNADHIALGVILTAALFLFWKQWLRTDLTALSVTVAIVIPWPHPDGSWRGILPYQEAFAGMASPAVVMVTAMFIFGAAMVRSGLAERIGLRLFKACVHNELLLQMAVLGTTTLVSMFINDTSVVIIFLPVIITLCKEHGLSPSRYLLWAAYGSLLGGQWTLIGTRSNLIVSEFLRADTGQGLGFFALAPLAALVFVVCAGFLALAGRRWLPTGAEDSPTEEWAREYLTEAMVTPSSTSAGKTLDQIAWSRQSDLSVLEIIRGPEHLPPSSWLRLQAEDVLVIQGPVTTISKLLQSPDFVFKEELRLDNRTLRSVDLVTIEALIGPRSDYAGRTLEEMDFRQDYGFSVLGISRQGAAVQGRPLATTLEFGDSLLLLGHVTGAPRLHRNPNLILLGQRTVHPFNATKVSIMIILLLGVVGTAIAGVLNPAISIPLVAILAILLGCVDLEGAYDAIDWQAVFTTAGMIPFGLAAIETGAVETLAHWAVANLEGFGPTVLLALLLGLALLLTHFIDNSATAVVLTPLAMDMAQAMHVNPLPFVAALAVCISASFSTPIAHESTILVMGPGRYRFKHYLKIGGVMALLTWLLCTFLSPWIWPLR
ncbi:MAG TPA: SLC13 family permease [Clostridia bacterium]|nr:SLC13 family permease [Clostridia bacterium]